MSPPATCAYSHDDAAYVLGALSPTERLEFERHLAGCDDCSRSVRGLAGMPGLLDLVDASVLEHPPIDPPLPATLLPALSRAVETRRRRRTAVVAAVAAAAAAVAALSLPTVLDRDDARPTTGAGTTSPSSDVESRALAPLGEVPIRATLDLEPVTWGTRMLLRCTYDPAWVDFELPDEVDYLLYVRTTDGRTEQVGSWRSVAGTPMQVPAATSVVRDDIATVEVRTSDGRVVLRMDA
jgi:Putative zinc-finger